jgi:hypothetical protein
VADGSGNRRVLVPAGTAVGRRRTAPWKWISPIGPVSCSGPAPHGCLAGAVDLTALSFGLEDAKVRSTWVTVHDRVASGETPPPTKQLPPTLSEVRAFTNGLT